MWYDGEWEWEWGRDATQPNTHNTHFNHPLLLFHKIKHFLLIFLMLKIVVIVVVVGGWRIFNHVRPGGRWTNAIQLSTHHAHDVAFFFCVLPFSFSQKCRKVFVFSSSSSLSTTKQKKKKPEYVEWGKTFSIWRSTKKISESFSFLLPVSFVSWHGDDDEEKFCCFWKRTRRKKRIINDRKLRKLCNIFIKFFIVACNFHDEDSLLCVESELKFKLRHQQRTERKKKKNKFYDAWINYKRFCLFLISLLQITLLLLHDFIIITSLFSWEETKNKLYFFRLFDSD